MATEVKNQEDRNKSVALLFADTMAQLTEHGQALEQAEKERKNKKNNKSKNEKPKEEVKQQEKEKAEEKAQAKEEKPEKETSAQTSENPPASSAPAPPEEEVKELDIKEELPQRETISIPKDVLEEMEKDASAEAESEDPDIFQENQAEEPPKPKKKKKFKSSKKKIAEEISEDEAKKIMKGKPKDGFRGTLIIHKKVVDTNGQLVKEDISQTPAEESKSFYLVRLDTGEAYELNKNLSVGRDLDNDIVIANPEGHYVSGHHADIVIDGNEIRLKDAGSTNGTFINGSKIKSKRIYDGNEIKFADIEFVLETR